MARPDVFISATSTDLRSYREVAKQALLDIGAHPIEQSNFPTDFRELTAILAKRLDPCDAVIHLAGFVYGGEPLSEEGIPRRSYTQWEYHQALSGQHPKPLYVFLARADCAFDSSSQEDEEKRALQLSHRNEVQSRQNIYYEFSSHEELRELIHRACDLHSSPQKRIISIPFRPLGNRFTGRSDIFEILKGELAERKRNMLAQPSAIYSDGGVGKTALIVEIGWTLFQNRSFDFVFFLNATTAESFESDFANLCASTAFNLPEGREPDQNIRRDAVLRYLHEPGVAEGTLLLIDGADSNSSQNSVLNILPNLSSCAVLITSRYNAWTTLRYHRLELFTQLEARAFLRSRIEASLLNPLDSDTVLDEISDAVDHLPLALELAVSYMRFCHLTPQEWLKEWATDPRPTLIHFGITDTSYPLKLARVWDRTVSKLSSFAFNLLGTLAWFAPKPNSFPLDTIKDTPDWPIFRAGFAELSKASLIEWETDDNSISIHRLLQIVTRSTLAPPEKLSTLEAAFTSMQRVCPHPDWNEAGWRLWPRLLPHVLTVLDHLKNSPIEKFATTLMQACALWLKFQARYTEAEPLYRKSLAIDEKTLGSNHPQVIVEKNNLGRLLDCTENFEEAEAILRDAVEKAQALPKQSPSILSMCLLSLSQVLTHRNTPTEKETILRQIISLNDSTEVSQITLASALVDLASLEEAGENRKDAETHYRQALSLYESHLDPFHPHISHTLDKLGQLLIVKREYAEAKEPLINGGLACKVE